jgi:hypothetical protein
LCGRGLDRGCTTLKFTIGRNPGLLVLLSLLLQSVQGALAQSPGPGRDAPTIALTQSVVLGETTLQIDFAEGAFDLPRDEIVQRIRMGAHAVTVYYGRFPVPRVRILVIPVAGRHGVLQGTTWGDMRGFPAFLRLRIGQGTTREELTKDWVITHELVHTALASLPDDQHWLEEGLASYVEPIARVQAGELPAETIWADMMHGMLHGEPGAEDHGLNNTHTWGRTYWGGALFCLIADVHIRTQTGNRRGLQDALRAIVSAGGTIDKEWPLARLLSIGDQATGAHALIEMYAEWSEAPVPVDLPQLWTQLGIERHEGGLTFNSSAPLAAVRAAITARPVGK